MYGFWLPLWYLQTLLPLFLKGNYYIQLNIFCEKFIYSLLRQTCQHVHVFPCGAFWIVVDVFFKVTSDCLILVSNWLAVCVRHVSLHIHIEYEEECQLLAQCQTTEITTNWEQKLQCTEFAQNLTWQSDILQYISIGLNCLYWILQIKT